MDFEAAIYIPFEGGQARVDDQENSLDEWMFFKKSSKWAKLYNTVLIQFILINLMIQIVFIMYTYKIGINQDKYECIVRPDDNEPVHYKSKQEYDLLMRDKDNVNFDI